MTNIFEDAARGIQRSKIVIWIFLAAVTMLVIGANHFIEDTLSSYYGIRMLETFFNMKPVSYKFTYFTMSIAPQVAQIVFAYMFMSNTRRNKWAGLLVLVALVVDFFADSWYRSDAGMFNSPGNFIASVIITFAYFTVGSEGFITVGIGIVLELLKPAIVQIKEVFGEVLDSLFSSADKLTSKPGPGGMPGIGQKPPQFTQNRPPQGQGPFRPKP